MTQHILLVWVHEARSKPLQRGWWWVNYVSQVRCPQAGHLNGSKFCTSQRGTWSLGFPDVRLPFAKIWHPALLQFAQTEIQHQLIKENACLLCRPFVTSGILWLYFTSWILFCGHTDELWDVAQLNHSLLCCHIADQNTRFALPRLPVLSQFLPTRRLHNTPHSRPCCSRHYLWPCHLCPHQHPLCMGHNLLSVILCQKQSLPTMPSALLWLHSHQPGCDQCRFSPCCTA